MNRQDSNILKKIILFVQSKILFIFRLKLFDNSTGLLMVMERLGNVDAVKSARFSSRGYASFASLFASRFRSTTPIDRVLSFVVLRI